MPGQLRPCADVLPWSARRAKTTSGVRPGQWGARLNRLLRGDGICLGASKTRLVEYLFTDTWASSGRSLDISTSFKAAPGREASSRIIPSERKGTVIRPVAVNTSLGEFQHSRYVFELDGLVTCLAVLVLVISAGVPFSWVIEERTAGSFFDRIDDIHSEVGRNGETVLVGCRVLLGSWIHNLSCSYLADQLAKGRRHPRPLVNWLHLLRSGYKSSLMATPAELINRLVFELLQPYRLTKKV